MITIPRDSLREAVETGLKDVAYSDAVKADVRQVAETERFVAFGTFCAAEAGFQCGCPMTVAGYADAEGEPTDKAAEAGLNDRGERDPHSIEAFTSPFDGSIVKTAIARGFDPVYHEMIEVTDA